VERGGVTERGRAAVYGLHAVSALLDRRAGDVVSAALLEGSLHGRLAEIAARLDAARVPVERRRRHELDRLAGGGVHQGVVLKVAARRSRNVNDLEALAADRGRALRLLVLDQVEDPRNLGACLRTADAAGVDAVVVPKAHSAKLGGAAEKAATGAAETVPLIVVPNLARALNWLKAAGVWIVGADERGPKALYEAELKPPLAIVLGAEGKGLRRLTRDSCDELIRIPMQGTVASLNVSVAAGVLLFEVLRQAQ
jgi:23S rRNA (guanosine2251-2'-O)-methyltransferase